MAAGGCETAALGGAVVVAGGTVAAGGAVAAGGVVGAGVTEGGATTGGDDAAGGTVAPAVSTGGEDGPPSPRGATGGGFQSDGVDSTGRLGNRDSASSIILGGQAGIAGSVGGSGGQMSLWVGICVSP